MVGLGWVGFMMRDVFACECWMLMKGAYVKVLETACSRR